MTGSGGAAAPRNLMRCELSAALPGFWSYSANLDERRRLDNLNVGTFILHRLDTVACCTSETMWSFFGAAITGNGLLLMFKTS